MSSGANYEESHYHWSIVGIGKDLSIILAEHGYELGLMARRMEKLEDLQIS